MSFKALALVFLPDDLKFLESDIGGMPAGAHLLAGLRQHDAAEVEVVVITPSTAPIWCADYAVLVAEGQDNGNTPSSADVGILIADARTWLSQEALRQIFLHAREALGAFRVVEAPESPADLQGGQTFLAWFPRGLAPVAALRNLGLERLLKAKQLTDIAVIEAFRLDPSNPPRLLTSCASLAAAEEHLLRERALSLLNEGVRLRHPGSVYVRGELLCGTDVEIDIDVIFEGSVVLANGVRVGPHSIVRESRIGEDTCIRPFSVVEHSSIGANSSVGPYARIRPGSVIGDGVQIGNYVEIKSSRIGAGSRINHHSFIGDALLADHVTIGAGTITCNHDGTGTNQTVIETGAYIGSGCNLVAPVRIGERATVGAGSTITRDVPAAKLTLARTPQTTIADWRGPRKR